SCASDVVFSSIPGTVTISNIEFGDVQGNQSTNAPDHVTIRGFKLTGGFAMSGDANFITVDNVDGGAFRISGGKDIPVKNSDFGPCQAPGDGLCDTFFSTQLVIEGGSNTDRVTLENNYIHNFVMRQDLD